MGNILQSYNQNPNATNSAYNNIIAILQNQAQNINNFSKDIREILKENQDRADAKNKAQDEKNARIVQEAQAQDFTNSMRFRDAHTNEYLANQYKEGDSKATRERKQKNLNALNAKEAEYLHDLREKYKQERGYNDTYRHKSIIDHIAQGVSKGINKAKNALNKQPQANPSEEGENKAQEPELPTQRM